MTQTDYILTLSCTDACGIVAAVTGFLAQENGFIHESTQFGDPSTERFFMRVHFAAQAAPEADFFKEKFQRLVADPFSMEWELVDSSIKPRVLILCSKQLHCVNDLLHRYRTGSLKMEIPAVISNHEDARGIVEWSGIPFYHFPTTPTNKAEVEAKIRGVMVEQKIDLVVLARYMQILSPELSRDLRGRAINIHHSFLPSFKGAKPYHQAYERGVKIIGATAHYVTDALDEGPIIDQEVARVDHAQSPDMLVATGEDIEARVLARTVKYWVERRILLNGNKTVVFR
jgi:formyltetrahydrofolate deformylase